MSRVTAIVGAYFALTVAFLGGWLVAFVVRGSGWVALGLVLLVCLVSLGWGVWRGWNIAKAERYAELLEDIDAVAQRHGVGAGDRPRRFDGATGTWVDGAADA